MDKSRYVLLAIAGVVAAIGGALFQNQSPGKGESVAPQTPAAHAAASGTQPLLDALAKGELKARDGTALSWRPLQKQTVINFWATWCAPCVEEMPELERLSKALPQQSVIGIAIDNPTNVNEFLKKTAVTYPIALAGLEGTDFMRALGNATGGLPFTIIIDAQGKVLFSKTGKTSEAELRSKLAP